MDNSAWTRPDEKDDEDWERSTNDRSYTLMGAWILSHADSRRGQFGDSRTAGLRQTAVVHYHQDVRGSTIALSDERGRVDAQYRYTAYGTVYGGKPSAGSRAGARPRGADYLYSQSRLDAATRHTDYGYRDYAPSLARFTSVDPIRDGRNWMMFVDGDPINRVDLWGLAVVDDLEKAREQLVWIINSFLVTEGLLGIGEGVAQVVIGGFLTQADSPIPGPMDVVGGLLAAKGVADVALNWGRVIEGLLGYVEGTIPSNLVGGVITEITNNPALGAEIEAMIGILSDLATE